MVTLKFKSVNKNVLQQYINNLKMIWGERGKVFAIINLPTRTKLLTVLKSPHVNKTARMQYHLKVYTTIIQIKTPTKIEVSTLVLNKPQSIKLTIIFKQLK